MDEISLKVHDAYLVSSETIALGVKKISFQVSDHFNYTAGQYIWLEIFKLLAVDPRGNRRAYSICNAPNNDNIISIIVRAGESGFTKTLFSLDDKSEVRIHGPFGSSFVVDSQKEKNLIMIAGGVGIAPFISVIEKSSVNQENFRIDLLYFNSSEDVTPFLKELDSYTKINKKFTYISKYEHLEWDDIKKYVLDAGVHSEYWISGTQGFVDNVSKVLIEGGISISNMVFENFYPTNPNTLNVAKIEQSLKDNNILTQAIQNSTNHTIITDINGVVLFANKASEKMTGYSNEEIIGNTPRLWGGLMKPEFYKSLWKSKASGIPYDGEIINRRKNGELYYALAHISVILDENNQIIGYIGTETDITDIKNHQKEIEKVNEIMIGRELKMIELKKEIKDLMAKQTSA